MTEISRLGKQKIARRSLLSGAVMLGGGAALSAVLPSPLLTDTEAEAEIIPKRKPRPISASGSQNPAGTVSDSIENKAKFSKEFLSNQVFQDLALDFAPPRSLSIARSGDFVPGTPGSKTLENGAVVQPNGDILFCIYAPKAKDLTLKFSLVRNGELILVKRDDGVFEGLLPYDENHTGPMSVDIYIDGMVFLDPFMPIHWSGGRPHNFIEVPDAAMEFMFIKNVPHGAMSREIYWTDVVKSWERCIVYTPPGYMKSNKEYPVLYLQHGGGENEVVWEYCGRVAHIMDNLIAEGKAEPFLIVMNNGTLRYSDTAFGVIDDAFERMLIESCIPNIEKNYRVKTSKWDRAIAGLSMGSYMACDIGFRHPEVFGSLGAFTASMTHEDGMPTTYVRPYPTVMKNPIEFARNYRVYFRSTTPVEDHLDYFFADDKLCEENGIDKLPGYHRTLYPKRTTKWNSWRMGLHDYAQLLFRA